MRNDKRLLPAIALATAALLLTGEWFNCCRINEAFAGEIAKLARSLGLAGNAAQPSDLMGAAAQNADAHPHCHGHAAPSAPSANKDAAAPTTPDPGLLQGSPVFAGDFHCLSENSITRQSMVGSEAFILASNPPAITGYELPVPMLFTSVERPRPQNRSSPPVYLLTLRLLV